MPFLFFLIFKKTESRFYILFSTNSFIIYMDIFNVEENEISLYVNIKEDVFKIKHEEIVTDIRPNLGNFSSDI